MKSTSTPLFWYLCLPLKKRRRFITFITIIIEMNSVLEYLSLHKLFLFATLLFGCFQGVSRNNKFIYENVKLPTYLYFPIPILNKQKLKGVLVTPFVCVASLMTMMIIIIIHNIHLSFSHFLFMSIVICVYLFLLQAP